MSAERCQFEPPPEQPVRVVELMAEVMKSATATFQQRRRRLSIVAIWPPFGQPASAKYLCRNHTFCRNLAAQGLESGMEAEVVGDIQLARRLQREAIS